MGMALVAISCGPGDHTFGYKVVAAASKATQKEGS